MSATQPSERVVPATVDGKAPLHIVLVQPEIPPNTGNVARLCAATGCRLHLVEPLGFSLDDRDLKRAGLDYWKHLDVVVHRSLDDLFAANAETARWYLSVHAQRRYTDARFAFGDMLLFGKETAGLPRALIDENRERALRIPQRRQTVRSLNLSTAAGIVVYAALAQLGFPGLA